MSVLPRYRFDLVELTIHWSHVCEAIELEVVEVGGAVVVDVAVWWHSDYWDIDYVARRAAFRAYGRAVPGGLELAPGAPVPALEFPIDQPKWELFDHRGRPTMPAFWDPLIAWARARWAAAPDPSRVCAIPAALELIDPAAHPPRCLARFTDAHGARVAIEDKEPIFRRDEDPPDTGEIHGVVEDVRLVDKRWLYRVDVTRPWGLATADGATEFDIPETALRWRVP